MAPHSLNNKQRTLLAATEHESVESLSSPTEHLHAADAVPPMGSTTISSGTCSFSEDGQRRQDNSDEVDNIIHMLKTSAIGFYGTTPLLASRAEFFQGGFSGDIAVVKDSGDDMMELLISGIFQIDRQNFFLGPEGGYTPLSSFKREFLETKLSCQLIPVQRDAAFDTARADFGAIVSNVKALEKLILSKKGATLVSCVCEVDGVASIRLSHSLFMRKDENVDPDTAYHDESRTLDWPVQERTKGALERAALTHVICPLPAFDQNHESIVPSDYHQKLYGAVVIVHFALVHYYFRQDKKSVFSGIVREMVVLRNPLPPPTNPLKRSLDGEGPLFTHTPSFKKNRLPPGC
ncbi:hypothetical protein M404DRAFT_28876 [Pisolithus tinctorius Marx 270]|uniref:Uncharacterized protein n=1 Tax=Pisolithus tinctorius Marx 270 TaxID=870435 RepID=A0A0C3P224_PISTI|nr:hypothetical protein M404DRAFT_28876 [Pisolithus tinctorius Marx 270]